MNDVYNRGAPSRESDDAAPRQCGGRKHFFAAADTSTA
jgi:hypothetical protein